MASFFFVLLLEFCTAATDIRFVPNYLIQFILNMQPKYYFEYETQANQASTDIPMQTLTVNTLYNNQSGEMRLLQSTSRHITITVA